MTAAVKVKATPGSAPSPRRSSRHRSREFALQGLYQWQLAGAEAAAIEQHMSGVTGYDKIDGHYFQKLIEGVIAHAGELEAALACGLDRKYAELSPVERAILLIAAFEFSHQPDIPYRVVINEAVELAKRYGGTDGHKYVNGVLDKLAMSLRPREAARG